MAQALPVGGMSIADEVIRYDDWTADITIPGAGAQRGLLVDGAGTLHFVPRTTTLGNVIIEWSFPAGYNYFPVQVKVILKETTGITSILALM